MSISAKIIQAAAGVGGAESDEDFASTTLLLQADDVNDGSQNNTFLDSSTNTHTITRNGNVTQGSFSPFSQDEGKWGNYFDGTDDYLEISSAGSSLDIGTNDFTIEGWMYSLNDSSSVVLCSGGSNIDNRFDFCHVNSTGLRFFVRSPTGDIDIDFPDIDPFTWTHVAIVRDGNDLEVFYNGVSQGSTTTSGFSLNGLDSTFFVGARGWTGNAQDLMEGYISNLRVINGTAVYTPILSIRTKHRIRSCDEGW